MTEKALTKEEIFQTFTPRKVTREPRPDRVGKEGVPPFVDFVEFRDQQGVLRYATPVVPSDGPEISEVSASPTLQEGPTTIVMDIGSDERRRGLDELEWEILHNIAS